MLRCCVGGDDDEGARDLLATRLCKDFETAAVGQLEVAHDEVIGALEDCFDPRRYRIGRRDLVPLLFEECGLLVNRQLDLDGCAGPGGAVDGNCSVVFGDRGVDHRETEAGAAGSGGDEWFKSLPPDLFGHPDTVISPLHDHSTVLFVGRDFQLSAFGHCLQSVSGEVPEYLSEQMLFTAKQEFVGNF
jgi:hypothetical protein